MRPGRRSGQDDKAIGEWTAWTAWTAWTVWTARMASEAWAAGTAGIATMDGWVRMGEDKRAESLGTQTQREPTRMSRHFSTW
jgi:hypothetical protein